MPGQKVRSKGHTDDSIYIDHQVDSECVLNLSKSKGYKTRVPNTYKRNYIIDGMEVWKNADIWRFGLRIMLIYEIEICLLFGN